MRCLRSFWEPEVAQFGPLGGPLSIDLEVPFLRLKLGRTSTLTMLSFSRFRLTDLFPKILRYKPLCRESKASSGKPCIPREYLVGDINSESLDEHFPKLHLLKSTIQLTVRRRRFRNWLLSNHNHV